MAKSRGTFVIDNDVPEKLRNEIGDRVKENLGHMKNELADREPILKKRQDFFEGNHHRWTNVQGEVIKQVEGHILAVINYIYRFCQKLHQALTNSPPRIKIKPLDESDEIETLRAEMVEDMVYKVLRDNKFFDVVFKRCGMNQVRDADFALECKVVEDELEGKHIEISPMEDLLKVSVLWDDASGSSFSGIIFKDKWTLSKIKREFGFDAEPMSEKEPQSTTKGSHQNDQYGMFSTSTGEIAGKVPTGANKLPKAEIIDYWGYEVLKKKGDDQEKVYVVNLVFINNDLKQFVVTDYKKIPRFVGHSFISPGKPWSMGFIDPLVDPQIELNDRTGEEGDLIRVGSHMKFLAVNMEDFDPDSIKPGSGQVIFIEGEDADFRPLVSQFSNIPSETYLNRMTDHLHTLGLPKIALSSGTAPYTGRVAAIQYQPIVDVITDLRIQWETVMTELIKTIQEYFIDYFPESHSFMTEHIAGESLEDPGTDGKPIVRDVEFDWDNVLPLSRSDKVVDASTLRDRHAISLHTYLEEAGFRNASAEIKKLKIESNDKELMALMEKFSQFSRGATQAAIDSRKQQVQAEEEIAAQTGQMTEAMNNAQQPTPKSNAPVLNKSQNDGRRGVPSGVGTPTGQTASAKGAVAQTTQNMNAKAGV